MTYELHTLDRALRAIDLLSSSPGMRLNAIADALGTNPTTALRTLRVLEKNGFTRRTHDGAYHLGTRLVELGSVAADGFDVTASLRPSVVELTRVFGVTAHIGMLHASMVTVVDKVEAPESTVRYSARGTRMPLHTTAAGKAALAIASGGDVGSCGVHEPLKQSTPKSITRLDALQAEVDATARRGYSLEREEYNLGFCCVGSAIAFVDDVFTVSLSGPLVDAREMERRGRALRTALLEYAAEHEGAIRVLGSDRNTR